MKLALAAFAALAALMSPGVAHATETPTVNLTDVPWIDKLPTCHEEDCSDQRGQIGVWTSRKGDAYIELGQGVTVLVVDDTTEVAR